MTGKAKGKEQETRGWSLMGKTNLTERAGKSTDDETGGPILNVQKTIRRNILKNK